MDVHDPTTQVYAAGISGIALLLCFLLYQPSGLVQWLQKKNYQYEVTFALYMLTPTEKFVFNSVLFLTLSLFALATCVYLPDHVLTMSRRTYYYFAGEALTQSAVAGAAKAAGALASEVYAAAVQTGMAATQEVTEAVGGAI
nr:hypothetical protein CFP56_71267 [Quercus suber]